ncbi:hypothetical protein [Streptomyces virginiae]|uniref:hypothetical protein n=1 Tax=Streptomyces virginiae TaxID=1961 RepID=UPI002255D582|nr:hypothetical protein [Streptomyces virginiae]MCX5181024.1 hypothetical protein [Streptomyces virginiae]
MRKSPPEQYRLSFLVPVPKLASTDWSHIGHPYRSQPGQSSSRVCSTSATTAGIADHRCRSRYAFERQAALQ